MHLGVYAPSKGDDKVTVEVKKWKYSRPLHIPEGVKEVIHPCGCKEYEENGIWYVKRCPKHKLETDALIKKIAREIT